MVWDSTSKAIFRDYSKYEVSAIRLERKEQGGIYTKKDQQNKTLVSVCGVKKKEVARTVPTFQAIAEWGYLL